MGGLNSWVVFKPIVYIINYNYMYTLDVVGFFLNRNTRTSDSDSSFTELVCYSLGFDIKAYKDWDSSFLPMINFPIITFMKIRICK